MSRRPMEDEYERKFMSEGGIVHQSKAVAPPAMLLLMASPVIVSLLILGFASRAPDAPAAIWLGVLPSFVISLVVGLLFAVLRATVTKTHVHIQYGLFGPRIPLDSIEACETVDYDWKKYGGFGIRRGADGSWAYNMMGDRGRAVRIRWREADGSEVVTLLSAHDPEAFVRSVDQAKAAARPRTRIAARTTEEDALVEAERELDAEDEAARCAKRRQR